MSSTMEWIRRHAPFVATVLLLAGMFSVAKLPSVSATETDRLAAKFQFTPLSIGIPGGYPQQTSRRVNQDYEHIRSWLSAVGAGIAMNDLDGDGLPNDLCLVDPRIDQVVVTPVPDARAGRYEPFALDPRPLPVDHKVAPGGCVPGDFNEDGRMDLLVNYYGRTPIVFLARDGVPRLSPAAYLPAELIPNADAGRDYTGPQWQSSTIAVADLDGDGHSDIYVGNYFPDGPVLDDTASGGVVMNRSMSAALNGGEDHVLRWTGGTGGPNPTVRFEEASGAIPDEASRGWVLAAAANDLDGDLLPELYLAQDFGTDRLLYNRSTPGKIAFSIVLGVREPLVPKSKQLGNDSFKGMGVDIGDLDGDGLYDMSVSNITSEYGIQESNFTWVCTAVDQADLRQRLQDGEAPWRDVSAERGLAWSGWGWDVKMGDFNNGGDLSIVQTTGFVKGTHNRWAQLQELAIANDGLLEHPRWWPRVVEGDDVGGDETLAFYVKSSSGRYVNLGKALGLAIPVPTRAVATGDADGDGLLDFAVARQWDAPVFYHNDSPPQGSHLNLRLVHEQQPGSPVVGAQVTVTTAAGRTFVGNVDGGSGHTGKRSSEVFIGLGSGVESPVAVHLKWRDRNGHVHEQRLALAPGRHLITLGATAQEVK